MKSDLSIANRVLDLMIYENHIPESGNFEITEDMIIQHIVAYRIITKNKGGFKHETYFRFARKLAGKSLLELLERRGYISKAGFVYIIENSVWPEYVKVGMTTNVYKRLNSYQTGDPLRQYKIKHYDFVTDRRFVERAIFDSFNMNIEQGERIKNIDSVQIMNKITSYFPKLPENLKK